MVLVALTACKQCHEEDLSVLSGDDKHFYVNFFRLKIERADEKGWFVTLPKVGGKFCSYLLKFPVSEVPIYITDVLFAELLKETNYCIVSCPTRINRLKLSGKVWSARVLAKVHGANNYNKHLNNCTRYKKYIRMF